MSRVRRLLRNRLVQAGIALSTAVMVVALAVFEPWKLWVDKTVVEALPVAPAAVALERVAAVPTPAFTTLSSGTFISHEHGTTGTVRVLQLSDGSRVVRLEDLRTSNGPDLKVVLSDAPVIPGKAGWHVFDDDQHVKIGNLKGNKGSQNYVIPAAADLALLRSVSIWCDRFNVSFGAAELVESR